MCDGNRKIVIPLRNQATSLLTAKHIRYSSVPYRQIDESSEIFSHRPLRIAPHRRLDATFFNLPHIVARLFYFRRTRRVLRDRANPDRNLPILGLSSKAKASTAPLVYIYRVNPNNIHPTCQPRGKLRWIALKSGDACRVLFRNMPRELQLGFSPSLIPSVPIRRVIAHIRDAPPVDCDHDGKRLCTKSCVNCIRFRARHDIVIT